MASRALIKPAWLAGGALLLLLALFLLRAPILRAVGGFLVIEDEPRPADAIVLLNGGLQARPEGAAALLRGGFAPVIIIVRDEEWMGTEAGLLPNRTDVAIGLLNRMGVPDSAILQISLAGGAASTSDEARAFAEWAGTHPVRSVLLVTSHYHTRRSRYAFRRALRDTEIEVITVGVEDPHFPMDRWWRSEHGLIAVFEEYIKLFFYVFGGDDTPQATTPPGSPSPPAG